MLKYGTLIPACFYPYISSDGYPDICKFYTAMPTRSTESSAANQRRPVLYGSLNGGVRWCYETQSSNNNFYWANYCGNFYFNSTKYNLEAWAHKSPNSNYGTYKASAGTTEPPADLKLGMQTWTTSAVVPYNTSNLPNREICKSFNGVNTNRYFCIKEGGGYAYSDTPWGASPWTTTSFGLSNVTLTDDGGFKHICMNPEDDHAALVFFVTNDSNKYLRTYYCNTDSVTSVVDYTTIIWGNTTSKQATYKYVSIDYLPGVGFLIFYNDYSLGVDEGFSVRILRTYDPITGEKLTYNNFIQTDAEQFVGTTNNEIVQYGSHGWYCPWTKEYFFAPNAYQVFWTSDGINWNNSVTTGASRTTACQKFLTDGQSMVVATSGSAYYYSRNKGQGWTTDVTLSPNGFNTARSNDTIVLPFKCENNIGINTSDITLGYSLNISTGAAVSDTTCFYTNEYIPVDPDTSYVFYGACITPHGSIAEKQKTFYNRILYYDSNHNFISGKEGADYTHTANQREVPCLFTSPSNAAYARISCMVDNTTVTQESIGYYKWYFAKESDFKVMTEYGDIVVN